VTSFYFIFFCLCGWIGLGRIAHSFFSSLFFFVFLCSYVQQARNMATLKELKLRISSTKNIQKITKSMKMIASTKLVRAQREMEKARVYGGASDGMACCCFALSFLLLLFC